MDTIESIQQLQAKTEEEMKKCLEKCQGELSALRTGRANPQLLDSIKVEYYGTMVPLRQIAALSVPEPRTLEIRPWDPSSLEAIEKAIQKSDLGVNPSSDKEHIRLNFPALNEERRKEMVKVVRKIAEDFRVAVRNERRGALEKLKKAEKAKEISEDDLKSLEDRIQKLTDLYVEKLDEMLASKEKEILSV